MKDEMQTLQKKLLQQSVNLSLTNVSCNPGFVYIKCPIVKNINCIRY